MEGIMEDHSKSAMAVVTDIAGRTVQDAAMEEFGRMLLLNSVEDGRSFCHQMITIATGAIPVYLGLLKLWYPNDDIAIASQNIFFAVPVILFLLAAISFSLGYIPLGYEPSIGNLASIEDTRSKLMHHRSLWGWIGYLLFCLGILVSIFAVLYLT
jgi:hypothetical protein